MKLSDIPYGHILCPHCGDTYDLSLAEPTFYLHAPHNDLFAFILCTECHSAWDNGDANDKYLIERKCLSNLFKAAKAGQDDLRMLGVTTDLTIRINGGNIVHAIEYGHDLPREIYFGICDGSILATVLPCGIIVEPDGGKND